MAEITVERTLIVEVGEATLHLVFRWEGDCWVCRMANDFMEECLEEMK